LRTDLHYLSKRARTFSSELAGGTRTRCGTGKKRQRATESTDARLLQTHSKHFRVTERITSRFATGLMRRAAPARSQLFASSARHRNPGGIILRRMTNSTRSARPLSDRSVGDDDSVSTRAGSTMSILARAGGFAQPRAGTITRTYRYPMRHREIFKEILSKKGEGRPRFAADAPDRFLGRYVPSSAN